MIAALAAAAPTLWTGPAFGQFLNEPFNTPTTDITTDPNYAQYTYSMTAGMSAQVLGTPGAGRLQLTTPLSATLKDWNFSILDSQVSFPAGLATTNAVDWMFTGGAGAGGYDYFGIELKGVSQTTLVTYWPNFNSRLRVSFDGGATFTSSGYFPYTIDPGGTLQHLVVSDDGFGHFAVTLNPVANPSQIFSFGFTNTALAAYEPGLMFHARTDNSTTPVKNPVVVTYDNWTAVPEPSVALLMGSGGLLVLRRRWGRRE